MEPHCIPFTDIPHSTRLFTDYLYNFSRVADFYPHPPFASGSIAPSNVEPHEPARRQAVADVLAVQNGVFGGDEKTQGNIRLLREGRAVAVVTGQQAGLFGGPAYSVYKAMTAIHLAERMTSDGTGAVPVFWLASEDHDVAEVNHTEFLDAARRPLVLRDTAHEGTDVPVGQIFFDASIEKLRAGAVALWPREIAAEAEEFFSGYAPGNSYAQAFGRLMQRLFAGCGLVVLDPGHEALHALSRPLLRRALEEAAELRELIRQRDRALDKAGYHVQVKLRENATLVFALVDGHRVPIRRRGSSFLLEGRGERSAAELLEWLEREPECFSANVLLRSLVQDSLLPTVAYVAGPAEVAYFAQASALYDKLLGRMPVIVPRASLTLVEPAVRRLLERYRLALPDLFHGRPAVRARLGERHLPPRLQRRLETTQGKVERLLSDAAGELQKLDPTLAGAADTSRRKMLYQFAKLRGKAARAQAARTEVVERHLDSLFNSLYPERALQERRLNFLSFVARHGRELVARLFEQASFPCRDHQVFFL
ncbi:MAG: bacillithiol biosynthesis cysteine-adding enzyme BshC [Candidatus Acidiferrales bacterium]